MPGPIALVGSGEFLPQMDEVDRFLLDGRPQRVVHLPTAAGREGPGSLARWARMARDHYGAMDVEVESLDVIDTVSANDPDLAERIPGAGLVYLSGGDPRYCADTLRGSLVWQAIADAWRSGTALAGCSAGACTLSAVALSPRGGGPAPGLGPADHVAVIPHYDRARFLHPVFHRMMHSAMPDTAELIGVEEDTALVGEVGGEWTAMGRQHVVLIDQGKRRIAAGETVTF